MKYIRFTSDIHLDFDIPTKKNSFEDLWMPEKMDGDDETIFIIAGDLWHSKKYFKYANKSWIKNISKQFGEVVVVLGNHDFWGGNLSQEYQDFEKAIQEQGLFNVTLLQNKSVVINDIKIIGGTLWTDYNNGDGKTIQLAKTLMKDYKYIKNGMLYQKVSPRNLMDEHFKTKNFIIQNAKKDTSNQKVWVITHHLPSFNSIPLEYKDNDFSEQNGLYASKLDSLIEENKEITAWVHGHAHEYQDYTIGKTKILANPRGYRSENTGFNPWLRYTPDGKIID